MNKSKEIRPHKLRIHLILNKYGPRWFNSSKFFKDCFNPATKDVIVEENVSGLIPFSYARMLEKEKRKPYINKDLSPRELFSYMKNSLNIISNNYARSEKYSDLVFYGLLYLALKEKKKRLIVSDIYPGSRKSDYEDFKRVYRYLSMEFQYINDSYNILYNGNKLDEKKWRDISRKLFGWAEVTFFKEELFVNNLKNRDAIALRDGFSFYSLSLIHSKKLGGVEFVDNPGIIFFRRANPLSELYSQMLFSSLLTSTFFFNSKFNEKGDFILNPYEKKLFLLSAIENFGIITSIDKDFIILASPDSENIVFELEEERFIISGKSLVFNHFVSEIKNKIEETKLEIDELLKLNNYILRELSNQ